MQGLARLPQLLDANISCSGQAPRPAPHPRPTLSSNQPCGCCALLFLLRSLAASNAASCALRLSPGTAPPLLPLSPAAAVPPAPTVAGCWASPPCGLRPAPAPAPSSSSTSGRSEYWRECGGTGDPGKIRGGWLQCKSTPTQPGCCSQHGCTLTTPTAASPAFVHPALKSQPDDAAAPRTLGGGSYSGCFSSSGTNTMSSSLYWAGAAAACAGPAPAPAAAAAAAASPSGMNFRRLESHTYLQSVAGRRQWAALR